jgi:hypothetical protein
MLALLLPQAMLGAERGRSQASPSQSGSTAPALHTREDIKIPDDDTPAMHATAEETK